jgi:hypothetical protein
MLDFAKELAAWQPLFTTEAAVCATLAGLLFVALSLHAGSLRDAENTNLRRLGEHTFADFILVLFVALFFLVPSATPRVLSEILFLIVAVGSKPFLRVFAQALHDHEARLHRQYLLKRLGLSLLARALLLAGAVSLFLAHDEHVEIMQDLMFVFSGTTVLLIAATRNAWFLLVHELG